MNQALQNLSLAIRQGSSNFASGSADTVHALSGRPEPESFDYVELSLIGAVSVGVSPIVALLEVLINATGGWG